MPKFRARQNMQGYISAMQPLLETRNSAAYRSAEPSAIQAAATAEFLGEVSLQALAGASRIPRGVRAVLHAAAISRYEQEEDARQHVLEDGVYYAS